MRHRLRRGRPDPAASPLQTGEHGRRDTIQGGQESLGTPGLRQSKKQPIGQPERLFGAERLQLAQAKPKLADLLPKRTALMETHLVGLALAPTLDGRAVVLGCHVEGCVA